MTAAMPMERPNTRVLLRPGLSQTWRPLLILALYRLALASTLAGLHFAGIGPNFLGEMQPRLFEAVTVTYTGLAVAALVLLRLRRPPFPVQVHAQVLTDVVAVTLVMHASGGVTTGLGMLLVVSVAGGSLLLPGRSAFLFAALASLAVLGEQVVARLLHSFATTAYAQAGMLGATFFAAASLAAVLAHRARLSERLATERGVDLANMERLNEHIIQHMQAGIIVVDNNARIRLMNNAAWYLLGLPAWVERQPLAHVCQPLDAQLRAWGAEPDRAPERFRKAMTGPELLPRFTALGAGDNAGTLIFLEDTGLLAQQAQQMKLASLGRLTASIAHEIRNPLGAISHAAQLLGEAAELPAGERRMVEIIHRHSRRMNEIVENILQLSRREGAQPEVLSLGEWLRTFVAEFEEQRHLPAGRIHLRVEPDDTEVLADPGQLRQILNNLCENGLRYGRDGQGGAELTLAGGISRETRGPYLDVIDNGPGIPPDDVPHIFEPFFTTERSGTGLGLFIARELAETNRAQLDYVPAPTGGSCFRITFADPRRQHL